MKSILSQKSVTWLKKTMEIVSKYDHEIPQSQTAENTMASRGRAAQPSIVTRKTNKVKQPDDCNARMDIK